MKDFKAFLLETQDKKKPIEFMSTMPQYPTGFMYLDYGAGSYVTVHDENEVPLCQYHNVGLCAGTVLTIIAKSQGGKTTLAMRLAAALIEPFINQYINASVFSDIKRKVGPKVDFSYDGIPMIEILETEHTLPTDYAKKVCQYTNKLTDRHISIEPITTDIDLIQHVEKHIQYKAAHMKKIPMPMVDMFGRPIYDYPPTAIICDSSSQLLMEDCDDPTAVKKGSSITDIYRTAVNNAAGARRAKSITAMYSQLVNYAKKYNILIIMINHINKMLPMNGVPVKQYRGLRAGETINGGERAIYLTANILRLDVIKSIGSQSPTALNLGEGRTGFVSKASWIKSKSNSKGNSCHLCYIDQQGYDPLLSNLYHGKEVGDLLKSGNYFYVREFDNYKFTLKNYQEVFGDHPELFMAYYDELKVKCSKLLDNVEDADAYNRRVLDDIRDEIHQEYNGSDAMDMDDMFAMMVNS